MNAKRTCTLASIAKLAGVSKATVSRILNNAGTASAETRERVLAIARENKYVPDAGFRHLSGLKKPGRPVRTGNIGLLLFSEHGESEFAAHPYYGRLFWAIENAVSERGRHLIVSTAGNDDACITKILSERKVDGLLVIDSVTRERVKQLADTFPVVLVNNVVDGLDVPAVMPDEAAGVRKAFAYLRSLGHSKITFFYIADTALPNMNHVMRERAFRGQTFEEGGDPSLQKVVVLPSRKKSLVATCRDLLAGWKARGEMPTALMCAADTYALAFMEAAARLGIEVPGELSIIGADDTIPCQYVRPQLTSIRQPFETMGASAVGQLINMIESEKSEDWRTQLTMLYGVELVTRQSCARVRA